MVVVKNEDEQIMLDIAKALMDDNKKIVVETINASIQGRFVAMEDTPQVPTKKEKHPIGMSDNRAHMLSAKIGKDISVEMKGDYFLVKTPNGESKYDKNYDSDFFYLWTAIGYKYDHGTLENSSMLKSMLSYMSNKKIVKVLSGDIKSKSNVNKFEKAANNLKSMGIKSKKLQEYIAQHQND